MKEVKKFVFVSNYLNHHQIPFCNAMSKLLGESFAFIQTEPVEAERVNMGWKQENTEKYLVLAYEQPEYAKELIAEAPVVLFGGCEDESYIADRLEAGKPVIRYSERIYKTGQWKAVSPRGLKKKYHDHTRHKNKPVYLLCSGAYVSSDFHIIRAYTDKMYSWGYFPETKQYDVDTLMKNKGWTVDTGEKIPYILWTARMIPLKHPEYALETAKYLKDKGIRFHMEMIGAGELKEEMEKLRQAYGLEEEVSLPGFLSPEAVRAHMEQADIFLFTSNREEGWGAVANESMNSGCVLVADHMIGAVPFLVRDGENGLIYKSGHKEQLFELVEELTKDRERLRRMGRKAYETIVSSWNAENAARQLAALCIDKKILDREDFTEVIPKAQSMNRDSKVNRGFVPVEPIKAIPERKMYRYLHGE